MARIKIAYVGGGSTRAPGTLSAFIERASAFAGSEIVLVDLDPGRLEVVRRFGERLAAARGVELRIEATLDRRSALRDCDAVLTSFRPGGFAARALDERIPLRHGVIGQETQGPGGFFMALRSIHVMRRIAAEMEALCPRAWIFNYTNPVNIVAQALSAATPIPVVSLCEGPIVFPRILARAAGLDPDRVDALMVGLNHACWSVRHAYDGGDLAGYVREAHERARTDPSVPAAARRLLSIAAAMDAIPAEYFLYYYYELEILEELRARPTTRAEDILAEVPGYWRHYEEQAAADEPALDAARSRVGILELELAVDVMDAMFNGVDSVLPVNVPNRGALPGFPDELVVEVPGRVGRDGIRTDRQPGLPRHVAGLVEMLAEYQLLAAHAALEGTRRDGIRALASNPLVRSLARAEALYDELAHAHAAYLPERLVP